MYASMRKRPTVKSCEHSRVYSGENLVFHDAPTLHGEPCASWYWICERCLEVGADMLRADQPPEIEGSEYWRLMRSRDPGCWIPNRYRN